MSDLKLAGIYIRSRLMITILTVISVALGLGLAVIVLLMSSQAQTMLGSETANWDLVIGAKGSPLQLVLNALYYLDAPTGNINKALWAKLKNDPQVDRVIPLNMGDSYLDAHIIGTVPEFFTGRTAPNGGPLLAQGQMWTKPFEVVVGADVAARDNLRLGQQIISTHGWMRSQDLHKDFPYTVVGIMARTGGALDQAIYCDYHCNWIVHAKPDPDEPTVVFHDPSTEVTALLVHLNSPAARFGMQQEINLQENAMAAIPVDEISRLEATFVAPLQGVLLLVAYLVVLVSVLSILISLYLTIYQRRRDLAIIRSLGATRSDVFRLITVEAALLAALGVLVGWFFGHGLTAALAPLVFQRYSISLQPWQFLPRELVVGIIVWVLGILAGLLPALLAYRMRVAESLMEE
jgi:putative ABC transport system permease protein